MSKSPLRIDTDPNGESTMSIPFSDHVVSLSLLAGVSETTEIPMEFHYVLFNGTADFYVKHGAVTCTIPADDDSGDAAELNPTLRSMPHINHSTPTGCPLALISNEDCIVTIACYSEK